MVVSAPLREAEGSFQTRLLDLKFFLFQSPWLVSRPVCAETVWASDFAATSNTAEWRNEYFMSSLQLANSLFSTPDASIQQGSLVLPAQKSPPQIVLYRQLMLPVITTTQNNSYGL
jgi:hypothetical protein